VNLEHALRTTGSARRFLTEEITDSTVHAILDLARFSPSGGNRQPWKVAVVKSPQMRTEVARLVKPVWDEYMTAATQGQRAYNMISYQPPAEVAPFPYELLDYFDKGVAVLVIAADLREIAVTDLNLERPPIVAGASIYPFCWSILLAAREHGLSGVLTTFLSRTEQEAGPLLGLPEHHGLAATIVLGRPEKEFSKLTRHPVEAFATTDRFDGPPLTS
jgi:nitroreductase